MPLHTDLRIKNFDDFLSNEGIIELIRSQIKNTNRAHTYLFSGQPGTGKTTLAYLLAEELGLTVEYINIANDNGVDFARGFIGTVSYPGFRGDIMYILDEAHRLTPQAQDILLTTLESPPDHVYIAMCSSEPEKFKDSTLRRCTKYSLNKPPRSTLTRYLTKVNEQYKVGATKDAIRAIVAVSRSSPGDALQYLEQIKGVAEENQIRTVKSFMDSNEEVIVLCRSLLNDSWDMVAENISKMDNDPEKIRKAVMGYMSKVLLNGTTKAFPILKAYENVRIENGMYAIIRASYEGVALRIKGGY